MRIAILGNSGSGKSTLARRLVQRMQLRCLDLDTVAWEPDQIAVPRSPHAAADDVRRFCAEHERWVIEGCYASLIRVSFELQPRLVFLNPGEERCLANCRERPWEPHKYPNKAEQDERLPFLLSWVSSYYRRDDDMSLAAHRACFEDYTGRKQEVKSVLSEDIPADQELGWSQVELG
jgi:adenylate kinase family enzyme